MTTELCECARLTIYGSVYVWEGVRRKVEWGVRDVAGVRHGGGRDRGGRGSRAVI